MQQLRQYLPPDEIDCVVYHHPCADGFAGAYVFWKYLKEKGNDNVRFIPFNHLMDERAARDEILPQVKDRNVVFVDVCPESNLFLDMLIQPNKCVVLDHHESALKTTEDYATDFVFKHCHIDQTHSGCILAHQYCYPDEDPPLFLKCIQDRDLWAWKMEDISRPFSEAFSGSTPFDFEAYSVYEDELNVYSLIEEGKILLKYKDAKIMNLVGKAMEGEITIDGKEYAVYIINTVEHISDLGHVLSQTECKRLEKPCDFVMMWYYDQKWGKIKVSLRSDGDRETSVNVSEIARYFGGGGGHPNASGFAISNPDMFVKILNSFSQNADDNVASPQLPITIKKATPKKIQPKIQKESNYIYLDHWIFRLGIPVIMLGVGYVIGKKRE